MSKDAKDKVSNPYIPKFISTRPWYRGVQEDDNKEDLLSHQRNGKEIIDFSEAKPGEGIQDDLEITETSRVKKSTGYDSKRDRWFGYDSSDWDIILKNWNDNKSKKLYIAEDDSDDTDFELELIELGLSHNDYKNSSKEDSLEGAMRDRKDIPSYLLNISLNDSKIKYDPKSKSEKDLSEIMNKNDQFVRQLNSDVASLTELQRFAWEANEKDQEVRQRNIFTKKLENLAKAHDINEEDDSINLDFNIEGNPTYMEYKLREKRKEIQVSKQQKRQRLISLYGDSDLTNEEGSNKVLNKAIIDKLYSESSETVPSDKKECFTSSSHLFGGNTTLTERSKQSTYNSNTNNEYNNNSTSHTLAFGSYYSQGSWGYKCCHQVGRDAPCK